MQTASGDLLLPNEILSTTAERHVFKNLTSKSNVLCREREGIILRRTRLS